MQQRRTRVSWFPVIAMAVVACSITMVAAHTGDGVDLSVARGPGAGEVTLDWTGGQPTFEVFRSTDAVSVLDPGNSQGTTAGNTWNDTPPAGSLFFFMITSPCVVDPPEVCDGVDNDCDGTIDEAGAEDSCSLPNATPICTGGNCEIDACDPGFDDCDTDPETGCEADLGTDVNHCGGCGVACNLPNATPLCSGGSCEIDSCDSGFDDCDLDPLTGCEVFLESDENNCGSCGVVCAPPNAAGLCDGGDCEIGVCDLGFEDCDLDPGTGCEVSTESDVNNCGGCGIACNLPNATAGCAAATCFIEACDPGFFDVNGDVVDGCECAFLGADLPDPGFVDENCDGIDGDIAKAIFVSTSGSDANPGTINLPVETIGHALTLATAGVKDQILVDAGIYSESLTLKDGVGIYGGYSSVGGWSRSAALSSHVDGGTTAVSASNLTTPTRVDLMSIASQDAGAEASSYGVLALNSDGLSMRGTAIVAGAGGGGASGSSGTGGGTAGSGQLGQGGCEDSTVLCETCNTPGGGNGGGSPCGRTGGKGGTPGKGSGHGSPGAGGVGGTSGGAGTPDGLGNWNPTSAYWGKNGADGSPGTNGAAGAAAYGSTGYGPVDGGAGGPGQHGNGGGGGGGGGGGTSGCDSYGGRGGGGGGGGCAGNPGQGGASAGGSFAIYLWASDATLQELQLTTSAGGTGGNGGAPGNGGNGGFGANCGGGKGNCYGGSGEQDDGSNGGRGGDGGDGGDGGAGGGGAGGPSICIVQAGGSTPVLSGNACANGVGGNGGSSSGNAGPAGLSTDVHTP